MGFTKDPTGNTKGYATARHFEQRVVFDAGFDVPADPGGLNPPTMIDKLIVQSHFISSTQSDLHGTTAIDALYVAGAVPGDTLIANGSGQFVPGAGGGASGPAGGVLSGNYPNPGAANPFPAGAIECPTFNTSTQAATFGGDLSSFGDIIIQGGHKFRFFSGVDLASIDAGNGAPIGAAPKGSLFLDFTTPALWFNTDGTGAGWKGVLLAP